RQARDDAVALDPRAVPGSRTRVLRPAARRADEPSPDRSTPAHEPMTLTTTATLLGLALAGIVAWALEGADRNGTLAGAAAGAAVTAWGVARQRRAIRTRPAGALRVLVEGFLV